MYIVKVIATGKTIQCQTKERAYRLAKMYMQLLSQSVSITEDKPEEGKIYALTGGTGSKCIMNGSTWAESEVK